MVISSRAILAMGLCTAGLGLLVGPCFGQQQQDAAVRRTASTTPATPTAPVPPVIGTIDMDAVFKNYEKVKVSSEEFKAAALARKAELQKIQADAQQEAEILAKLAPGTEDFKKHENKVTELKARFEAGRESAERDFAGREAEAMATLYREVQAMVRAGRPVEEDDLRRQGVQPAGPGKQSQFGHGRDGQHHGLCRPPQRHHQRCGLQPEPVVQGQRWHGGQAGCIGRNGNNGSRGRCPRRRRQVSRSGQP